MPTSDSRVLYFDSSALVKLVIRETESDALLASLAPSDQRVSCALARVEVIRAVWYQGVPAVARARALLDAMFLVRLDSTVLDRAADLAPDRLRSLDAIHLAAAHRLGDDLDLFVTYDRRLAEAASAFGMRVSSPGQ